MKAGVVVIIGCVLTIAGVAVMSWPVAVTLTGLVLVAAGFLIDFGDPE